MAGSRGYQVRVRVNGELDPAWWSGALDGVVVVPEPDGTSVLAGELRDQAELHGLLGAIRDFGLSLVSIETTPVTPRGEPRSTGVVYAVTGHRIYAAVAPDSWKARHIGHGDRVSLTVPIRRGGLFAMFFPIPPATVSVRARAVVHAPGSLDLDAVSPALARFVPAARRGTACVLELVPEGQFLTYGIGVPLKDLADPARAMARVPVA